MDLLSKWTIIIALILLLFFLNLPKISLDFSRDFCHHLRTMQKIEKWRVEELALVISELSDLLRKGDDCEWANVFSHYHQESQKIVSNKEFNIDHLKKLVTNVKNCFSGASSLNNLVLWNESSEEMSRLNQELFQTRARLLKILEDMEDLAAEPIS